MVEERYRTKSAVFLLLFRDNNGKKQIALQQRANTGSMDGMYDSVCSGHLDPNEPLSRALVREAKEEAGLKILESDLKMALVCHRYDREYIDVYFTCEKYEGEPQIMEPDKCSDMGWFDLDNLPENLIPKFRKVLEVYFAGGNYLNYEELQDFKTR